MAYTNFWLSANADTSRQPSGIRQIVWRTLPINSVTLQRESLDNQEKLYLIGYIYIFVCVFIYSSVCILLPVLEGTKKDTVSPKDILEYRGREKGLVLLSFVQ